MKRLRKNRAKHKLQQGEIVACLGGHNMNTSEMIDFLGPLGYDAVWIETEHGPQTHTHIPDASRACDLWGMTSIVRVNSHDYGLIYRTLDLGAQAIVAPHVNTADEARAIVDAAKFYPLGKRGMYLSRQGFGVDNFFNHANDETMIIVLIEDILAVENLDEILNVDNIDVFFVAPSDLAQSMGHLDGATNPEVSRVIDDTLARIVSAGRVAGAMPGDTMVEKYVSLGVRFLLSHWTNWLEAGAARHQQQIQSAGWTSSL